MAIISFSTASGTTLQYDDATSEFIINPNGDSLELIALGYNNTRKTIAQLASEIDGQQIFTGRADFSGNPKDYPFIVVKAMSVLTNPNQIKVYVDRDATITSGGSASYGKDQMTDNLDGTHYIDVPYTVYDGYVYQFSGTERWYFPSIGPFDVTYPQSISYVDAQNGRSDTYNANITYTEINLPKILQLDGVDVSSGQVPLLNTAAATMPVKWLNSLGVEQNDTEPVTPHNEATFVNIVRETTATATYNHKTGLPVPTLLFYRDDLGNRVDFNGIYVIPDTVVNQPITLGWSITNGNIPQELEQVDFTDTLTVNEFNDVIMPAFTDNWGNAITLASRTQTVEYGTAVIELLGDWLFNAKVAEQIIDQGPAGNDVDVLASAPIVSSMLDLSSGSTSEWAKVETAANSSTWMMTDVPAYGFGGWFMLDASIANGKDGVLMGKCLSVDYHCLYVTDSTLAGDYRVGYAPYASLPNYFHKDLSVAVPKGTPFHVWANCVNTADGMDGPNFRWLVDVEVFYNGVSVATFQETVFNNGSPDVRVAFGGANNNNIADNPFRVASNSLIGSVGKCRYKVNGYTSQQVLDWYNDGSGV